mgnify:CR=1 FL=1
MVLVCDLRSRAGSTAAPPAQWQRGSEAAEGPEAALWTSDRRRWPEDAAPGGSRGKGPAGHRYIQNWYVGPGRGAGVWISGRVCTMKTNKDPLYYNLWLELF